MSLIPMNLFYLSLSLLFRSLTYNGLHHNPADVVTSATTALQEMYLFLPQEVFLHPCVFVESLNFNIELIDTVGASVVGRYYMYPILTKISNTGYPMMYLSIRILYPM